MTIILITFLPNITLCSTIIGQVLPCEIKQLITVRTAQYLITHNNYIQTNFHKDETMLSQVTLLWIDKHDRLQHSLHQIMVPCDTETGTQ